MENSYLRELLNEVQNRDGGIMLNLDGRPQAVVLSIEKYNQLLGQAVEESRGNVLVTGGAGYIGAHLSRRLLAENYRLTIVDNLSTGRREYVPEGATFVEGDLADVNLLRDLFAQGQFDAVIHLASSLEVAESVEKPQEYFDNNFANTLKLLAVMQERGVKNIIFSSSAAVYGEQKQVPISEIARPAPNNPYAFSKWLDEEALRYFSQYLGFRATVLRYFNVCGAGLEGELGDTHHSHLIPIVFEVIQGQRDKVVINGDDYKTSDGTCVRDYVHVLDIAQAHVLALQKISEGENFKLYNVGTKNGFSVRQVIDAAAEITNRMVPMQIGPRRQGDAACTLADTAKIERELGFTPEYSSLETIIKTCWLELERQRRA